MDPDKTVGVVPGHADRRCPTKKQIISHWYRVERTTDQPTPIQNSLHKMFVRASPRWRNGAETLGYIKSIGGNIIFGVAAAKALAVGIKEHVVFFVNGEHPSVGTPVPAFEFEDAPAAIVLPEETAIKILVLENIPDMGLTQHS